MTDNKIKKKHDQQIEERPLDPSRSAQDLIGDVTGLTGITTGNPKVVSAEPEDDENNLDLEHEPGGVLPVKNPPSESLGVPKESYNEKVYEKNSEEEMSVTAAKNAEDVASEEEKKKDDNPSGIKDAVTLQGAQTVVSDENATQDLSQDDQTNIAYMTEPSIAGEQSVSGDMPTPDSDDDTLANAQAVGTQTHEDPEHPEEIDIARDIDEAEEYERTH